MHTTLAKYWNAVRSSFWFAPSLMTLAAMLACVATTVADEALGASWVHELGWFTPITPQGARELLATVAGSMITVAGVTFSITIAAVSYASANLGPRLLPDFMRDVRNQVSLGTFIATFVYCILVLRTIRGAGESGAGTEAFVPYIGVMAALALTLANVGVLIFYIHHVPTSISAFEVVARLGRELYDRVGATPFPAQIGEEPPEGTRPPDSGTAFPRSAGIPVRAETQGYLTHLDAVEVLRTAQRHDVVVRFDQRPGDFISPGVILAHAHGARADDPAFHDELRSALIVERERTPYQDILFIVQQLAQIAARALSPGVNDPYTANGCVNWLGGALIAFGNRPLPSPYRYDKSGALRAIVPELSFAEMASAVFDQLRPYVGKDRNAALHALAVIGGILENVDHPGYRAVLLGHAAALKTEVDASIAHPDDRALFARSYAALNRGE